MDGCYTCTHIDKFTAYNVHVFLIWKKNYKGMIYQINYKDQHVATEKKEKVLICCDKSLRRWCGSSYSGKDVHVLIFNKM